MALADAAHAQAAQPAASAPQISASAAPNAAEGDDTIVVTARLRDETSMSVPISVTVLGAQQIDREAIRTISDVARFTPGLVVGEASSGLGGAIMLRGVGTTGNNSSFDQTVSVNIDGVQISRGNALRVGQIDMASIQVLRGSQALFFGKNSPAGIISIRTADPTDEFDLLLRATYDPIARGIAGEAMISGTLAPGIAARLVASHSTSEGYFINDAYLGLPANAIVPGAVRARQGDRGPQSRTDFVRATLLFQPWDNFTLRAKYTYSNSRADGLAFGLFQRIYCEGRVPQLPFQLAGLGNAPGVANALRVDDCTADNHFTQGDLNPAMQAGVYAPFARRRGLMASELNLASLEANYEVAPHILLTSITGHVTLDEENSTTFAYAPSDASRSAWFGQPADYDAFTQEVRVVTSIPGSVVNGVLGAFYEKSQFAFQIQGSLLASPTFDQEVSGRTFAAYGQLLFNLGNFELAGGARYTHEVKDLVVTRALSSTSAGVVQPLGVPRVAFNNLSPELTLTYRPNSMLTAYAAYKHGFKSGGFSTALSYLSPAGAAIGLDASYGPETVRGGEVGLKLALDGGRLRLNLAGYYNRFSDLQVSSLDASGPVPVIRVLNAAAATVKGIEADFNWRPLGARGLNLFGAVAYNDAVYTRFLAPCFIGQTVSEGCNLNLTPATGRFTLTDRAGQRLINAPQLSATLGAGYEFSIASSGMRAGINADLSYRSRYNSHPDAIPWGSQAPSLFVNAGVRIFNEQGGWELAFLGRNLTEVYRAMVQSNIPGAGNALTTGSNTPGGHSDLVGSVNRGRELLLRLTLHPSRW